MPRVILRTVEPAKLLACQSVEKRCTRANASAATSAIICSVNGTMPLKKAKRKRHRARPSTAMAPKARSAEPSAAPRSALPGEGVDEAAGEERHQHVGDRGDEREARDPRHARALAAPQAEDEGEDAAKGFARAAVDGRRHGGGPARIGGIRLPEKARARSGAANETWCGNCGPRRGAESRDD